MGFADCIRHGGNAKLTVALGVKNGGGVLLNADCEVLMKAWQDL